MTALRFALRNLGRDLKSGELGVLLLALVIAVGSLTAVGFFVSRIAEAVADQAHEVLAADLRLESPAPIAETLLDSARARGLAVARLDTFPTAIWNGDQSQLAALIAAGPGYPLRGRLRIADRPFGLARPTDRLPARGEVWLDARILATLGVAPGATLRIGGASFRITAVLDYRPDQGTGFVNLAPSALIALADLPATGLVQPGSRVTHVALFAGTAGAIAGYREFLREHKAPSERLRDVEDSSRQLTSAIERATRFLNLASLAAVLIAAVAVAMAARRYAARHVDGVALMKCMGASQAFVLATAATELLILALAGLFVGAALGWAAQNGLAWLLRGLIHSALPPPSATPLLLAAATVAVMLLGFALPPLLQLRRTPPLRVLRKTAEPPRLGYGLAYGAALLALLAIVFVLGRDPELVLAVLGGVLGVGVALALAGALLLAAVARLRGGVGVAWRYGLANVARRGAASVVQVVAFGLGLLMLLLLAVVRADLLADWRRSLPANAPNYFVVNIRPEDREALAGLLAAHGVAPSPAYPMIRARLTAVNGQPAEPLAARSDSARAYVEREQNLTWSANLADDNRLVAGRWWTPADAGRPLVSVSTEYQQALGLALGDELSFDVAGEPLTAKIASFRKIRWDSFRPNFFLVFPPRLLDGAAGTYLTSLYLPQDQRPVLAELVHRFPSVTVIDVDAILAQIREIVDRASLAVQYVFLFTLAAGVVVLLAAVQATRDERRYESAMLRTLGASRRTVLLGVAAEFVTLGGLAGALAAVGATAIGWALARRLFAVPYDLDPWVWVWGIAAGTLLVGAAGTLATRRVVEAPPLVSLRDD